MSWPTVSLEEISESVVYGLNASATNDEHGPRFLRITDIHESSVDWNTVPSCECSEKELEKFRLSSGDIVFARTGATTGKSCLIRNCPTDSVFASYLIRVRLNEKANPEYISHFFNSPIYWAQVRSMAVGAAQPGINATKLKKMQIPLPPIDEQKRIATILDKAEEINVSSEQVYELRNQLIHSTFDDLIGDPVLNPHEYDIISFEDGSEVIRDGTHHTPNYTSSGVRFVTAKNLTDIGISFDKCKYISEEEHEILGKRIMPQKGDLLITKDGTIGRCSLVEEDNYFSIFVSVALVRPEKEILLPKYLLWLFRSFGFQMLLKSQSKGAGLKHIHLIDLRKMPLLLPPIEIQQQFVTKLENITSLFDRYSTSKKITCDLKLSLSQELFIDSI
jgi:type I restriction enzyme, S subunit